MAVDLGTGVPWVMCKQTDAPDPVVGPIYSISFFGINVLNLFIDKSKINIYVDC